MKLTIIQYMIMLKNHHLVYRNFDNKYSEFFWDDVNDEIHDLFSWPRDYLWQILNDEDFYVTDHFEDFLDWKITAETCWEKMNNT